jgi:hypothetical protein
MIGSALGQIGVSPEFSLAGAFKAKSVQDIASAIARGGLSPDDVPVHVIRWDGQHAAVNNRSLTALSMAGRAPTNVIDVTDAFDLDKSNPDSLFAVVQRLRALDFQPSPEIGVRPPGGDWQTPRAYTVRIPQTEADSEHDQTAP